MQKSELQGRKNEKPKLITMTKVQNTISNHLESRPDESLDSSTSAQAFERYSETCLPTSWGDFKTTVYRNAEGEEHLAISLGLDQSSKCG